MSLKKKKKIQLGKKNLRPTGWRFTAAQCLRDTALVDMFALCPCLKADTYASACIQRANLHTFTDIEVSTCVWGWFCSQGTSEEQHQNHRREGL